MTVPLNLGGSAGRRNHARLVGVVAVGHGGVVHRIGKRVTPGCSGDVILLPDISLFREVFRRRGKRLGAGNANALELGGCSLGRAHPTRAGGHALDRPSTWY